MQPTLGQRIKIIMDELSLTQAMISRASGIDNTKLSRILADKGDVMFKAIETLYLTYPQINPAYLLGGILPVLLPKNPPIDRVTALDRRGFNLYSWKHTGAAAAFDAGMSMMELRDRCRHASVQQTEEYLRDLRRVTNHTPPGAW